jgi:hypothetical protein
MRGTIERGEKESSGNQERNDDDCVPQARPWIDTKKPANIAMPITTRTM